MGDSGDHDGPPPAPAPLYCTVMVWCALHWLGAGTAGCTLHNSPSPCSAAQHRARHTEVARQVPPADICRMATHIVCDN